MIKTKIALLFIALMIISSIAFVKADIWQDDMEGDVSGWSYDGFWHLVDNNSNYQEYHSPYSSWWYGQESTGNYDDGQTNSGSLTTPEIDTTGITEAYLEFWSWYETETTGTSYDQRLVQISTDNNTWDNLGQLSGDDMTKWVRWQFNISDYLGGSVWIRFFFDTIDNWGNDYRGWYIDNVAIKEGQIPRGNASVYIHNIVIYDLTADLYIDNDYEGDYNIQAGQTIFAGTWTLEEENHEFSATANDSSWDEKIVYISANNTTEVHLYLGKVVDMWENISMVNVYVNNSTDFIIFVRNYGNFTANITIEITNMSPNWSAELNRTWVILNSGEETSVKLTVFVPEDADHLDFFRIDIRGWTEWNNTTFEDFESKRIIAMEQSDGPDEYGYWWREVAYNWIDISENGTLLSITNGDNDDGYGNITLPYQFLFYGNNYSNVYIGTNGLIGFNENEMSSSSNQYLPNSVIPNNLIAVFWDDLDVRGDLGSRIYYKHFTGSNYTIIQWNNVYFFGYYNDNITFQVIIYDNGNITMQYKDVYGDDEFGNSEPSFGASATVGIENETGEIGLLYAFNNDFILNNTAIMFYPPGAKFIPGSENSTPIGDEPYEQLKISIKVNVTKAGNYRLYAELWSEDNTTLITSNETIVYLDIGEREISVYFEGEDIYNSGEDGQYNVLWELYQEGSWELIDSGGFQLKESYDNEEFVPEFSAIILPLLAMIVIFFLLRRKKF